MGGSIYVGVGGSICVGVGGSIYVCRGGWVNLCEWVGQCVEWLGVGLCVGMLVVRSVCLSVCTHNPS